ncbi:DUF6438 domain-containing protein [Flavivirga spongiicola]|uniref:DUF6438 domain-containing protein n=1 Tax=Flavivirga spongiicola TaxID=421621 RepID=A0ABU7XXP5_9FLAO|nr:DUF6438 domain-containing protein [Flavivirga sp. MEBiC05379]MDO5980547.1 DUF6438 domain-containing protein [Flavivirga sp. MEBiC05379]
MKNTLLNIILITMILIASCKTSKKTQIIDTESSLISLSKGRCLGNCPVYDLWIFKNGNVIYNGIDNVNKKGIQEITISESKIDTLTKLMTSINPSDLGEIKGYDKPLSILRFNNKKFVYQSKNIQGNLHKINNLIENIHFYINNR